MLFTNCTHHKIQLPSRMVVRLFKTSAMVKSRKMSSLINKTVGMLFVLNSGGINILSIICTIPLLQIISDLFPAIGLASLLISIALNKTKHWEIKHEKKHPQHVRNQNWRWVVYMYLIVNTAKLILALIQWRRKYLYHIFLYIILWS